MMSKIVKEEGPEAEQIASAAVEIPQLKLSQLMHRLDEQSARIAELEEALNAIEAETCAIDYLPEHDKMYYALKRVRQRVRKALAQPQQPEGGA